jgi:hypothetical protein
MSRRSSTSERSSVCAAMLGKCVRGKRDKSDCNPEHHAKILRPIELLFLHGPSSSHHRTRDRGLARKRNRRDRAHKYLQYIFPACLDRPRAHVHLHGRGRDRHQRQSLPRLRPGFRPFQRLRQAQTGVRDGLPPIQEFAASAVSSVYASVKRAGQVNDIYASERMRRLKSPDPCLAPTSFSIERFAFFVPVFLSMTLGSGLLFIYLSDHPFGVQLAALVCYAYAVVLYTFSANRGMPHYLFSCPTVRSELPRIATRSMAFIAILFFLLTVALRLRPQLPASWLIASGGYKSMPPFTLALSILSACLALAHILTNRSILDRAHLGHSSSDVAYHDSQGVDAD